MENDYQATHEIIPKNPAKMEDSGRDIPPDVL